MASRPGPGRAISEALCPNYIFTCGQAPGRGLRALAQPAPQPGGRFPERICPVEPFSIVPRSLAGGCPTPPGRRDVTEKRILASGRHGKAHSGRGLSRKGALYDPRTNQTAVFGEALEQNALFGLAAIEGRVQSVPFREVRRSGQAWGQRVYTDRRKRPLGAVLGHLCTLLWLRRL